MRRDAAAAAGASLSASALPFDVTAHLNKSGGGDSPSAHTLNKARRRSSTVVSFLAFFFVQVEGGKKYKCTAQNRMIKHTA